ncbi:hypothetical protein A2757_00935 [Candidatus Giovannonibacteria bacterium RIFCSPHIGHO2_01_FULL_48_47]|nr:MAG: hypothetical protein A2757_00935 [Candidatus Giovannonibacteria bacterium RIFCSPHIGHO2_01_FULL_48_47]OGF67636.1 MAG: hypothetical protein A3D61_02015 [Candidatus Giovannonibacteria bacterium RIFCSPHIGHO2_02_FULL_48_15]OGF89800.1 MAG: hypothetical protein A3B26_01790 [Candidatus Giovannonibacteria bacterium RIFCSPLOWO2_01_FULL_48_47]OGF95416.1 MAG: hypothetical protein A2433_00665 [Candidatus Giovannonibacteria bacterium RIFOXYC1_FULL_48_8]OGF95963.1 MAG: hypothetical protein A2613_00095
MNQNKKLTQVQKGTLVIFLTALLVYFTGDFFGSILGSFPKLYRFGGALIGTTEQYRYIFGLLISPTFFLSLFLFLLTKKGEIILRRILFALIALVVIVNAAIGLSSIIFSAAFIVAGYLLARFMLHLKTLLFG